jgi:hypothetical protein
VSYYSSMKSSSLLTQEWNPENNDMQCFLLGDAMAYDTHGTKYTGKEALNLSNIIIISSWVT